MARVLLVEDDASLGQTLAERLERDGVEVVWVRTIAAGEARALENHWDLAIIDIRLPDGSGLGLARRIKRSTTMPVMFMTALNSAENRLEGYEIGADEYLPKPFHLKEFLLRVRHVLSTQRPARVVRSGGLTIDLNALAVDVPGQDRLFLQTRDGKVLAMLLDAAPRVVDRSEILDGAWGEDRFPTPRAVDNAIVRLRQALGDSEGRLIRSVRGVGYQWAGEVDR
jgi:two-component system, OmpR family, phosphate regulon response regulator PhoB